MTDTTSDMNDTRANRMNDTRANRTNDTRANRMNDTRANRTNDTRASRMNDTRTNDEPALVLPCMVQPAEGPTRAARRIALLFGVVAAAAAATFWCATAGAQPAFAIGKPLSDGNVPTGTVIVRVIAGSTSSPEVGVDAILLVNGTPRIARTDASGRATFGGLPAGATVVAKITDADKKEIVSDPFPVPDSGGTRIMMTTKPLTGSSMNAPIQTGAPMGGMPEARQISGQPRPDGGEPPGVYAVRVTYNNLKMGPSGPMDPEPPVGAIVHLVGYGADDSITVQTRTVDETGVAKFEGLDQSGGTSYFAMSSLTRKPILNVPSTNATPENPVTPPPPIVDRMVGVTVVLDGQTGVRVVLSGEKRDSTNPAVDDYVKLVPRDGRIVDAHKVRITLDGVAQVGQTVKLFDAKTHEALGTGTAVEGPPDPTQIKGGASYTTKSDAPKGTVDVVVLGGQGTTMDPLANVMIQLIVPEEAQTPIIGASGLTDKDGKVHVVVPADFKLPEQGVVAKVTINGKDMFSSPMDLSIAGGLLELSAQWSQKGKPEAVIEAPDGGVVYAETELNGVKFRSLPFELLPGAGMHANIYIYPRTLFTFDTHAFVDDQLLAVQGNFEISNYSWAPYRASADGLLIRLPPHYKGAIIAPQDQKEVSVSTGEGFRIMRPIPPGGRKFRAGFSMPIVDGTVDWRFDLPLGTWGSTMRIRQTPGMAVNIKTKGITGSTQTATTGEPWYIMENVTIERKQPFVLTISGFPAEAKWKKWVPRFAGLTVLAMILGGLGYALVVRRREPATADSLAQREKLMSELVDLEKRGIETNKDRQRRERLIDELERTWGS